MGKLMFIDNVDICCGLCWGDEAKGKIVTELLKKKKNIILYVDGVEVVMPDTQFI